MVDEKTCLSCGEEINGAYYPVPSPNNPPVLIGYQCEGCWGKTQ